MKSLQQYIMIGLLGMVLNSCTAEWEDELYIQMVSFKTTLNSEGVAPVYLRYNKNGEVTYNLPLIVSGSQPNQSDKYVKIEVDNDTLTIYNKEKYQHRTDLYFKQLPASYFELSSPTCLIPRGSNTQNFPIKFKFDNLDLVERYVLPLTIKEDPAYITNTRKGWRKALLNVIPFNDYSGNYSATSMNAYLDGQTTNPLVSSTRTAYVVDEKSVFFYAGVTEERGESRGAYKVVMEFLAPVKEGNGDEVGALNVYATNPAINFEMLGQPTYKLTKTVDPTKKYLAKQYYTVNLRYKYDDITTMPGIPVRYSVEGSMTMERQRNILIPDEDQAIEW
ncbi:DUF4973 domain-containing protein [Paraflavitalea pollutisoli]|uniref:DUF4973 domain-containing protein n=1 Tax=Paraflavitalea pollutisoli TaxID=3034143 RepID=UPI0023ED0D6A|nr:DUF4973 domain-containing protein [Paraflavitalea sp. H1-2-19X]